jgi:hypothetical protein
MKRIIYILATLAATVTLWSCGPDVDERMVAMDSFMDAQEAAGLYRDSKVEFAFDETKHQAFISTSKLTYRIMNDSADKYLQFVLSEKPEVGKTLNVEAKSYGFGLSSNTTYKNMTVSKIENNFCHLRSSAEAGYVGIIIGWIE